MQEGQWRRDRRKLREREKEIRIVGKKEGRRTGRKVGVEEARKGRETGINGKGKSEKRARAVGVCEKKHDGKKKAIRKERT